MAGASGLKGSRVMTKPSRMGAPPAPPGPPIPWARAAFRIVSAGIACRAAMSPGLTSSAFRSRSVVRAESAFVATVSPGPLSIAALWNSPAAEGMARRLETFWPPPDWPKIMTLSGSPPKAAMLSCTHCSASTKSCMPAVPEAA